MSKLDLQNLEDAFHGREDLKSAIQNASAGPAYVELFNQISAHIISLSSNPSVSSSITEPASKKRRLGGDVPIRTNGTEDRDGPGVAKGSDEVLLEIKDISLVIPQRKKMTLCFTKDFVYARLGSEKEPMGGCCWAWRDIEHIFCLPVPEKSQKQHNYVLFPTNSTIAPPKPIPGAAPIPEPLVFTIPDTAPKPGSIGGTLAAAASAVADDYKTLFNWAILARLKAAGKQNLKIGEADEKLFHSMQRQPHRPKEKAVHVKAFRGSKDGYLFFLPTGILWAFKKPLLFLTHASITAVSYTNVLQRTFNLNIDLSLIPSASSPDPEEDAEAQEFEFSMLDQEDFAGIDGYIKRYGLQDKSMAEQRKAKRENVNVVKDEKGNVVSNGDAGELEKLMAGGADGMGDEEEESEGEDYDPGTEGESEGSGSSDEEDDDEDGDGDGAEEDEDGEGDEDED